ncbi:tetratricopeptide repeat protein [Nocardia sienata]|uniref:tetratricopeptide repeat protein n=1 Tax=Nocardia sienata TaxID=248552 RepID=UPI0007A53EAE|nr:tetratricopeptide repeat protein [Nocardia sienata]
MRHLIEIAHPARAITIADPLLDYCEQILGTDHPDTLLLRHNLAVAYYDAGQIDEAILLRAQTLADRERVLDTHHRHTLLSRGNLAIAYQETGQASRAISIYEQALTDGRPVLGADNPLIKIWHDALARLRAQSDPASGGSVGVSLIDAFLDSYAQEHRCSAMD